MNFIDFCSLSAEATARSAGVFTAQLPTLPSGALETWVLCALALLPAAALLKTLATRKAKEKSTESVAVTREDVERLRDRVDARFLALTDKLEQLKDELLAAEERRAAVIHERLNKLEAGLARVDERTRNCAYCGAAKS